MLALRNPDIGFGAATICDRAGRTAPALEVLVKGKPRPELTRLLVDLILEKDLV
jgi:hypothetical protein